ncbi:hypothetical protein [Gloeobacter violaceus]|uniref:hypothetical protein n=1 Tax=Gloeobacter violaceus TaxID=33072 RepID=UPI0013E8B1BC|nr:hypothetical protein [Gloeobacter violaceus]
MKKVVLWTAVALLLTTGTADAYRILQGIVLPPVADNPPVRIDGISSSLQDKEYQGINLIWDTTVTYRNISPKPIDRLEVEISMADVQGTIMARLTCPFAANLQPEAGDRLRLRELYLAWPGAIVAAQLKSVVFADGERWPAGDKPSAEAIPALSAGPKPTLAQTPICRNDIPRR